MAVTTPKKRAGTKRTTKTKATNATNAASPGKAGKAEAPTVREVLKMSRAQASNMAPLPKGWEFKAELIRDPAMNKAQWAISRRRGGMALASEQFEARSTDSATADGAWTKLKPWLEMMDPKARIYLKFNMAEAPAPANA